MCGCGSSGGSDNNAVVAGSDSTYQFSFAMEEKNLCGQVSAYKDFEIVAYSDDGDIISRHQADEQGSVRATFNQDVISLMIIKDDGLDKQNLDITLLSHYPVSDLGTFTVASLNTHGCDCQIVDVETDIFNSFPSLDRYLNLPYEDVSLTEFTDTQLCNLSSGLDPLMVVSTEDSIMDASSYNHTLIESPTDYIIDDAIVTYFEPVSRFDHEILIQEGEGSAYSVRYISDDVYKIVLPILNKKTFNLIEHPRVSVNGVVVSDVNRLNLDGGVEVETGWSVFKPIDESTQTIDYVVPSLDQNILADILNGSETSYDFFSEGFQVIEKRFFIKRQEGMSDKWSIVHYGEEINIPFFDLPEDYLEGLATNFDYFGAMTYQTVKLTKMSDSMTISQFFKSGWLSVLTHEFSAPFDAYDYENWNMPTEGYSQVFRSERQQ